MIYVLLGLYFLSGLYIWIVGVTDAGGRKKYMMSIAEEHGFPYLLYYTAFLLVVIFWPIFLIRGLKDKDE